jgi:hypothetical protein
VAGVDPRLVGQPVEHLALEPVHDPGEPGRVTPGVAGTAGEQRRNITGNTC